MHAFQVYGQAISSKYQKIIIKVQPFQVQAQAISSKDDFFFFFLLVLYVGCNKYK